MLDIGGAAHRAVPRLPPEPTTAELFTPKLVTVLREGYRLPHLKADAIAGLTVAIVALPLSMAIAIASGATPAQGLYTAIFGGFLVSLLSGSRFQIGGPAGAFIVLVGATVDAHGIDGLILATFMSGIMLVAAGVLRLGTFIKFIPYPVTVGFTAGIAVIIAASQVSALFGLVLPAEPRPMLDKAAALWAARGTADAATTALALGTVAVILGLRRLRPHWPGLLIAVAAGAAATAALGLEVATIGTTYGGIPSGLPAPRLPEATLAMAVEVLPAALSFTLLGAIESLLSAVVADGMSGRRHRSNCELVAQGVANVGAALFTGFCVTGTIARTATNVRSGAHSPVSGILHAAFLAAFILVAAPLAAAIPLAALAGVLVIVAWNMTEKHAVAMLVRSSWGDAAVLLVTFALTVFRDLTEAIVVGFALGALIFIGRMSRATQIEQGTPFVAQDKGDGGERAAAPTDPSVMVYRITGVLFFGAAASIGSVLDRIADTHTTLVIDLSGVPFVDATGANMIVGIARKAARRQVSVRVAGARPAVRRALAAHGAPADLFAPG